MKVIFDNFMALAQWAKSENDKRREIDEKNGLRESNSMAKKERLDLMLRYTTAVEKRNIVESVTDMNITSRHSLR